MKVHITRVVGIGGVIDKEMTGVLTFDCMEAAEAFITTTYDLATQDPYTKVDAYDLDKGHLKIDSGDRYMELQITKTTLKLCTH